MRRHLRVLPVLALGAVLVLAAVAACGSRPSCAVCGREECSNLAFDIRLRDGRTVKTCCPRCGLHYIESERARVASLTVRAFDDAQPLPAEVAFYVEGSDVSPCAEMHAGPPRDARGCCLKPVYDRCLPSLLAFKTRPEAEAFAREQGGVVKTFAELRPPTG